MELRKTGKLRQSSSTVPRGSHVYSHVLWRSFLSMASVAQAIGIGKLFRLSLKAIYLVVALSLIAVSLVAANLFQLISRRLQRQGYRFAWFRVKVIKESVNLYAIVAYGNKTRDQLLARLNEVVDLRNSVSHETGATALSDSKCDKLVREISPDEPWEATGLTEEALPKYLSQMASRDCPGSGVNVEVAILPLASTAKAIYPYLNSNLIVIRTKNIGERIFCRILNEFFESRLLHVDEDEDDLKQEQWLEKKGLLETAIDYIWLVSKTVRLLEETVQQVVEECFSPRIAFKCSDESSVRSSKTSVAWSDSFSVELFSKIEEAATASQEEVIMSCIATGLRSYMQLMTGDVPDDIPAILQQQARGLKVPGLKIKLPLGSAYDPIAALNKIKSRLSKAKRVTEGDHKLWQTFHEILPSFLLPLIRNLLHRKSYIIMRRMDVFEETKISETLVRSFYHWTPLLFNSSLSFTIINFKGSFSLAIMSKKGAVQSTSLLAECISKAVINLAIGLKVQLDRRSPPASPSYDN